MQKTVTTFNTEKHHIHIEFYVTDLDGVTHTVDGILDTGAPKTEFSDQFLSFAGLINTSTQKVEIKPGLQTQKYNKVIIPRIEICGHRVTNLEAFVSRFDEVWGIDALIGLDFFRKFKVTIDYKKGQLITEPLNPVD